MTTFAAIWHDLAIFASRPGGWVLPVLVLFVVFGAIWALLDMAGSEDMKAEINSIEQDVALEQQRKAALDAAFLAQHPKFTAAGPKGARPGFTRDHHASVLRMGTRRNGGSR